MLKKRPIPRLRALGPVQEKATCEAKVGPITPHVHIRVSTSVLFDTSYVIPTRFLYGPDAKINLSKKSSNFQQLLTPMNTHSHYIMEFQISFTHNESTVQGFIYAESINKAQLITKLSSEIHNYTN